MHFIYTCSGRIGPARFDHNIHHVSPEEYIYHVPVNTLMAAINLTNVPEEHVMTRKITREGTVIGRISFGHA